MCGGDGTVRAVSEALSGTKSLLAVVPAGTANLFATGLKLPSDPADVIAAVVAGASIRLDNGTCNGQTFNVMAGSGFDAAMIADAEDGKERCPGRCACASPHPHRRPEHLAGRPGPNAADRVIRGSHWSAR